MSVNRLFMAIVGVGLSVAIGSSAHAYTEDFESLASDPTWTAPDNGWAFYTSTTASGTAGALTGTVEPGNGPSAPGSKHGQFIGTGSDNSGVSHANDFPLSGTFFFDALFNDDPEVGLVGQNRFWMNIHPGEIGNDRRPQFYINKSATSGKMLLQLNRGDNSYVGDNSLNLGEWYTYIITYDFPNGIWDLEIQNSLGTTVFNELGNYTIDSLTTAAGTYTTWETRYGASGSGKSLAWNIDNINVPEPASLALLGLAGLTVLRRRR